LATKLSQNICSIHQGFCFMIEIIIFWPKIKQRYHTVYDRGFAGDHSFRSPTPNTTNSEIFVKPRRNRKRKMSRSSVLCEENCAAEYQWATSDCWAYSNNTCLFFCVLFTI